MSATAKAVSSLLNPGTAEHRAKVSVEHLDYGYIEQCTDVKYLAKILRVLRSGDEGIYPHLMQFCESRLEKLDPRSRALRKDQPVATASSLPLDEWNQISDEIERWHEETKAREIEASLTRQSMFDDVENENLPPVRGSNISVPLSQQNSAHKGKKKSSTRALPRDYKEWDKFDVDRECLRIDRKMAEKDSPAVVDSSCCKIKPKMDAASLTEKEKRLLASREKDKGNEAFRANDYEEAVAYYSRSLSIVPTVVSYNNRAQAQIKLKHWHGAMEDCQSVLELEPGNMKALLRRATVHKQLGNFQMAVEDLRTVLVEEPQNAVAAKLLTEIDNKRREGQLEKQHKKGKKILIQEIEEEEGNDNDEDEEKAEQNETCPVEPRQPAGGEESRASPAERGDMGNAQKKPHGRGDAGGPHAEPGTSQGHRRSWGGSSDKYRVPHESPGKVANGTNKRGSTASAKQADKSSGGSSSWGAPTGGDVNSGGRNVNLDAPSGALPPPLARLKNEGNLFFKNGQFSDALEKYSKAITGFTDSGIDSPEDLSILHSNRAACYLKDGNSQECIQDCTKALELQPFSLKPLLRRAMAYDSLERYRKAYVDYKTVLQIDNGVQAAHDSVDRITRLLIEQDGPEWRENLPAIPLVPMSSQRHRVEAPLARTEKAARDAAKKAEVRFTSLKLEGNEFVKKGQFQDALGKYTECLQLKPQECAIYTNRALCYLKLDRFSEAKQDCDAALGLEPTNKKAFYRRAMANKGLKDYLACSSDLQEVLQQDPNVQEAERELEEVTVLLRQSLAEATSLAKPRRTVPIMEVEGGDDQKTETSSPSHTGESVSINLRPANAYEFGQTLNAARLHGSVQACADLLAATDPEQLVGLLSTQLDGHTLSFIMQALDSHMVERDPGLVYKHLSHLHTADRFSLALMLLEKDDRRHMTQLFERLSATESAENFNANDVQNLANKYI